LYRIDLEKQQIKPPFGVAFFTPVKNLQGNQHKIRHTNFLRITLKKTPGYLIFPTIFADSQNSISRRQADQLNKAVFIPILRMAIFVGVHSLKILNAQLSR